jgi:hypothetical protein
MQDLSANGRLQLLKNRESPHPQGPSIGRSSAMQHIPEVSQKGKGKSSRGTLIPEFGREAKR